MIESYIRSLDVAIGDRLPAEVKAQRLREAEGHLRMAAEELNQLEAIRRYGGARAVANAMVRVHRGYETASTWRLSLPLLVGAVLGYAIQFPLHSLIPGLRGRGPFAYEVWLLAIIYIGQFVVRVAQTRRWLFWPAQVERLGFTVVVCLLARSRIPHLLSFEFLVISIRASAVYLALNALTLGAAALADRRRVRRA